MDTIFNDPEEIFDIEPFKRLFEIGNHPRFPHQAIFATDGKQLPTQLQGLWTSKRDAEHAIDVYLAEMKQVAIQQAKVTKRKTIKADREKVESNAESATA